MEELDRSLNINPIKKPSLFYSEGFFHNASVCNYLLTVTLTDEEYSPQISLQI